MKFRLNLILFFFFLSFSYAQDDEKPDTALSLEQLLELVQQGKFAESEEAAQREQKFARERSRQATLLANAKAERSRLEAIATELEGKFEANDAKLVVLESSLKQDWVLYMKPLGIFKELLRILNNNLNRL